MSNWERMIVSKARHGSFRGGGLTDENAYYAFFADPNSRSVDCGGIVSAIVVIVTTLPQVLKVAFLAPATKLFREQT